MAAASAAPSVVDVGDAEFAREVIELSARQPVIVDFWAPWCGPCRQLGPALERVVEAQGGAVRLAKVNVDESPEVARRFGVQSIPLVIAFKGGAPVAEFVGAQPEPVLRRFVASLLPSEADKLVAEAMDLQSGGHLNAAEERLRGALAKDARHPEALLALARVLAERGQTAEALALLERISAAPAPVEQAAEKLAAELRTATSAPAADLAALRARAEARRYDEALPALLRVVERDKSFADEAARKAMLDVFGLLGSDHPLVAEYRRKLSSVLFR
jgi:putative thioredoxin